MIKLTLTILAGLSLAACPENNDKAGSRDPDASTPDASAPGDASASTDAGASTDASASTDAGSERASLELQGVAKLKQCGLYEAEGDPNQYSVEDDYDVCVVQCTLSAPCSQLKQLVCEERENTFTRCIDGCNDAPIDGFKCHDGARIPHAALCDLVDDCEGGEDEASCGTFVCTDGEIIPASSARCDWIEDCVDGSDELGCMLSCP
jgi:hypothetical protein